MDFIIPTDHGLKAKESENRNRYQYFAKEQKKKNIEPEGYSDTNSNCCTWNNSQRIGKWTGRHGNKRTSGDHPNYSIIKIDKNTEKSPEDLRRPADTQTPVKDHQLTLEWKTLKEVK